jgi:transcriptional regulator with XRE-family HTH domain
MSVIELVAETELGRGYISELERGLVVPNVDVLERIATAFGIRSYELLIYPDEGEADDDLISLLRFLKPQQRRSLLREVRQLVPRGAQSE